MDEMEYGTVKYTISKLIDKLSFAEHTAGTLQAENDRLACVDVYLLLV